VIYARGYNKIVAAVVVAEMITWHNQRPAIGWSCLLFYKCTYTHRF